MSCTWPNRVLPLVFLSIGLFGCASQPPSNQETAQKLRTIRIADEKLSGSPKKMVKQLNKLAKEYDVPSHTGVSIHFDPAVDNECCYMAVFREGEPLGTWLQDVCEACGAEFRVIGGKVVIGLLPISEKRTPDLEASLLNGMAQICQQFRLRRGQDRHSLGKQLLNLLPRSPITWSEERPMHRYLSYDFEHPNYKLYKRDVLDLLGEPDRNVNNQQFYYSLNAPGNIQWELGVRFGDHDYVENPSLAGN